MKCASVPSAYRNCILRASVWIGRNFSPARNVRSITAPSAARRSFVRTNAPPLPGLTCWNSMILKTVPSTSMWFPFLNWLVLITSSKPSPLADAHGGSLGPGAPVGVEAGHRERVAALREGLGAGQTEQAVAGVAAGEDAAATLERRGAGNRQLAGAGDRARAAAGLHARGERDLANGRDGLAGRAGRALGAERGARARGADCHRQRPGARVERQRRGAVAGRLRREADVDRAACSRRDQCRAVVAEQEVGARVKRTQDERGRAGGRQRDALRGAGRARGLGRERER